MITVRETQKSFILESDGCNREGAAVQGARVGRVVVPKKEVIETYKDAYGETVYVWDEALGIMRDDVNNFFAAAASRAISGVRVMELRVIK